MHSDHNDGVTAKPDGSSPESKKSSVLAMACKTNTWILQRMCEYCYLLRYAGHHTYTTNTYAWMPSLCTLLLDVSKTPLSSALKRISSVPRIVLITKRVRHYSGKDKGLNLSAYFCCRILKPTFVSFQAVCILFDMYLFHTFALFSDIDLQPFYEEHSHMRVRITTLASLFLINNFLMVDLLPLRSRAH